MVKIEILGETADEALANLRALLNGGIDHTEPEICIQPPVVTPLVVPHLTPTVTPVVPPPAVVPMVNPTIAPVGAPPVPGGPVTNVSHFNPPPASIAGNPVAPPVVPVAPPPSFTIDQIATAGAALVQAGKMPDLMALLGQFGVQAVTELKPEQLGPFATALRGLGANI